MCKPICKVSISVVMVQCLFFLFLPFKASQQQGKEDICLIHPMVLCNRQFYRTGSGFLTPPHWRPVLLEPCDTTMICCCTTPCHQCLHLHQWAQQNQITGSGSGTCACQASQWGLASWWPDSPRKGMDIFWGDSTGQGLFQIGHLDLDNLLKDRRV